MAQQHVLEVGDVVAVWPGENDSLFWLTICRDNVKQGYDPASCDIQTFFLRFSGQRQRGHMVFVEESDEKVFGCISLESIICKSIELLLGDNAGQGFSFLLPPEEEARITDAIRVWEEQGEGDGETLNQVKVEPTELDTLHDSTALSAEDTQGAHHLLRQQQPEQKQTQQFTVNAIISERESEEGGREYLLDWAESWECKSNIFHRPKGHVKKTKARPEKALGKTGGDKVDGLGTINEEVVRILEVEPSGVGRCYKVRWRPTWTSELECPVTFILQWRIKQKQKQRVEAQEVKEEEEEEIEDDEDSEEEEVEVCGRRKVTVAKRSSMLTQAADHTPESQSGPASPCATVAQPSVIFQDDHFEDHQMEATAPEPSQAQSPRTDRALPAGKTPATASTRPVLAGKTLAATPPLTWREVIRLSLAELGQASVAQLDAHIQANFPEKRGRQNSKATIRQNLRRIGQLCHHQAGRNQEWRLRAAEEDEEEEEEEEEDEEDEVDVDKLRELYATSRRPSVEDLRNQFIRATSDEDLRKKQEALMELEGCLRHDLEEEGLTDLPLPCKDAAPPPPSLPPVERRIVLVVWYNGIKYLAQYPRLSTADEVKTKTLRMAGHTEWINPIHYCLFLRPVCPEDTEREPTELADVRLDEAYHNRECWLFEGFWPPAPWPHWPGW